jgi:hypothetical protein
MSDRESSCAPSVADLVTTSCMSKKGKKSSLIWNHTREPLEHKDQELLYCVYCDLNGEEKPPHGANNALSITKHIQRKHPHVKIEKGVSKNQLVVQQQLKQLYSLCAATRDTKELDLKILEGSIQQDALLEALITLIVVHNLLFCLVE